MPIFFVAGTGQHQGKTTTTLGLAANLQAQGFNVGYCKPIGQKHVEVNGKMADKDCVLFEKLLDFELDPQYHSPVILASGVTKQYLYDPSGFNFKEDILRAANHLQSIHDIVIFEGTGHVGVGSVVDLSNAEVAKVLGSRAILVVEGGVGNTLDQITLNLALFEKSGVPIHGVIINKVKQEKMEEIQAVLGPRLERLGIPVLGYIPYDPTLSYPILYTVQDAIRGRCLLHPEGLLNKVQDYLAGSLIDIDLVDHLDGILLVVNPHRFKESLELMIEKSRELELERVPIAGIVVTGDGRDGTQYSPDEFDHPYILDNRIPILATRYETYDAVVMISRIEVKINTNTQWKVNRAIELFKNHIPIEQFMDV